MLLTDYFQTLTRKNQFSPIQSPTEEERQQRKFFKSLSGVDNVDAKTKKCVDKTVQEIVTKHPKAKNNLNWKLIWPQDTKNFGWTGAHLSQNEIYHFSAIEALFRTEWAKHPQDWYIFKNRKKIGADSVAGYILEVGPPNVPDMFVVKSPKENPQELRHEYFVGKLVCNEIRKNALPNFPYHFGLLECSSLDDPQNLKTWCESNKNEQDPQLVIENIRNSELYADWMVDRSVNDVISVIAQIFNAILHAFVNYGFSHNDLHLMNVMIRKSPVSPFLEIPLESDLGTMEVQMVPIIIDMGHATFKFKDQFASIPRQNDEDFSSSMGYSRPVNDLVKFVALSFQRIVDIENIVDIQIQSGSSNVKDLKELLKLKQTMSEIYDVFMQLIRIDMVNITMPKSLNDYIKFRGSVYYNLPVRTSDSLSPFENLEFLSKFVTECFHKVFSKHIKWNKDFCTNASKIVVNTANSFIQPASQTSSQSVQSVQKKRKI